MTKLKPRPKPRGVPPWSVDALQAALDVEVGNQFIRGVLIPEALAAADDPALVRLAPGYRYLGRRGHFPGVYPACPLPWTYFTSGNLATAWANYLPTLFRSALLTYRPVDHAYTTYVDFMTRRAADDAAATVFADLDPAEQAALMTYCAPESWSL